MNGRIQSLERAWNTATRYTATSSLIWYRLGLNSACKLGLGLSSSLGSLFTLGSLVSKVGSPSIRPRNVWHGPVLLSPASVYRCGFGFADLFYLTCWLFWDICSAPLYREVKQCLVWDRWKEVFNIERGLGVVAWWGRCGRFWGGGGGLGVDKSHQWLRLWWESCDCDWLW